MGSLIHVYKNNYAFKIQSIRDIPRKNVYGKELFPGISVIICKDPAVREYRICRILFDRKQWEYADVEQYWIDHRDKLIGEAMQTLFDPDLESYRLKRKEYKALCR